jgi:signal transduction histidine kinase/ActR/RegA family two-component response regulator
MSARGIRIVHLDRGRLVSVAATVVIALAVLAPLVLWGAVVRETVVADIARRENDQREITARLAGASIDRELRSAGEAITLFASGPTVREALRDRDTDVLDQRLGSLLQGRERSLGALLDPSGIVLAAPLARQLVGQDFSHRDYFRGAVSSNVPYVSEIFTSATAGSPSVVAVAAAIRDGSSSLGVVVLTLMPADMLSLLSPLRQVDGRHLVIADHSGRVVAATDPALRPLDAIQIPADGAIASHEPVAFAGRQRIVTTAPVESAKWTLFVVDDPAVVLAAQRRFGQQLVVGGSVAALLALVAAGGIAWLYAKSLRQRAAIAQREVDLQRANADLAAASRHKSEFLAGMSHELRTPLNAILGFSELLDEQLATVTSERQKRYLRNVRDAGQHLLGLINDVLDLSKVEAGRVELRPERTTLDAVVAPVVASTRGSAEAGGLRFRAEFDPELELTADIGRLRQILYNLLSNAVKFTPTGGEVALRAGRSGRDLRIEVRDSGLGIPAEKRDLVFGTFERLHEGRSEVPGTGLGLALTKSLVELHGGTITFESTEGTGTTFRVTLPELVAETAPADRLLVVEDERRDAELILALATSAGLQSEVVGSAHDARAAIRRAVPVAVVLDLRLPDERGERVLEALRSDPATRDVPVVVVTVEDDDGRSRLLGADDHLTKPLDRARLTSWLERVAARSPGKEVPPAAAAR